MANYQVIMRLRPEVRPFVRNRRWVHRGDVISYGPNISCEAFSTDAAGFRHSMFKGETLSLTQCAQRERYGLVLGPSSVYGFGLAGNDKTMPSLLAERFGFPFANIGMPEGNSRTMFAMLMAIIARAKRPPSAVVHISGGDYTSFCYTGISDPVFGPPNIKQIAMVTKERGGKLPPPEQQIKPLLAFTSMWITAIAQLCRSAKVPLLLGDDTTFFEKAAPSEFERESELGKPFGANQARQFDCHKKFVLDYHGRRQQVAAKLGVPLAGPGKTNAIGFVDEFHYDGDGTRALCDDFAAGLAPLL